MAVLPVYEFPHKILRQKAKKVKKIDKSIRRLAEDMIDTMHELQGVGLAANQVGVLQRVIVIHLPNEDEEAEDEEARVYVNPEIIAREGEREVDEGCLSLPGYVATITRSLWVKAKGLDLESKTFRFKAEGLLAQVLEHEIDHLNGILYIDHLKEHQELRKVEPVEEEESVEVAVG